MVVAPMLNGGRIENRWQPMSQLTWCGPSSRSTSFSAVKIGRSGQPVQNDGRARMHVAFGALRAAAASRTVASFDGCGCGSSDSASGR